jgi:CrcB protein
MAMEFAFNRPLTADDSYQKSLCFGAISMQSLIDWKPYIWVSLGGILGANLRYFLSRIITRFTDAAFPVGTLLINITGSLVLGFFLIWTTERVLADPKWRLLVAIGFCGSYTTFSSYAFETMSYFEQGHWTLFASNILANNILCLGAVLVGAMIARAI